MILRMIIMLVLCALVFGGVFASKYIGGKAMNQLFDNMPAPAATVSSTQAKVENWQQTLSAVGTLTAVNGIQVTSQVEGLVESIRFESGDHVKKGDILITLDSDTDRAELKTLEAQSRLAKTELQRLRKLFELESISKAQFDQAESNSIQSLTRASAQRTRIAKKTIRAPFSGELGIRQVAIGEFVKPGNPLVSLQALNPLYVDFKLPEQHIALVKPDQAIRVKSDLYPQETFDGKIQALEPRVDQDTRNFSVRAQLPNDDLRLKPGSFAQVEVILPGEQEVIIVPRTAISYNPYGNSVFVISEKTSEASEPDKPATLVAKQRFIKTGEARGDYVAISEGLEPGEQVATSGLLKLRNGQPVVINNDLAPDTELNPDPADT